VARCAKTGGVFLFPFLLLKGKKERRQSETSIWRSHEKGKKCHGCKSAGV